MGYGTVIQPISVINSQSQIGSTTPEHGAINGKLVSAVKTDCWEMIRAERTQISSGMSLKNRVITICYSITANIGIDSCISWLFRSATQHSTLGKALFLAPQKSITTSIVNKPQQPSTINQHTVSSESSVSRGEKNSDSKINSRVSSLDDGRKTAFDAINYLAHSVKKSDKSSLKTKELHEINTLIKRNDLTFYDIKKRVATTGDLKRIRELAYNGEARCEIEQTGLMGKDPQQKQVLTSIKAFMEKNRDKWNEINQGDMERVSDPYAQATFTRQELVHQLKYASKTELQQMLKNIEGPFGQRLRGVVDFASHELGQRYAESDDEAADAASYSLISTTAKYTTFLEELIHTLRNQLGKKDKVVNEPPFIGQFSELTWPEIRALSSIDIKPSMIN